MSEHIHANHKFFDCLKKEGRNARISKFFASPVMVLGLISCAMAVFSQLYADLVL